MMETQLQTLLDVPFIRRVRRNHGLEHATIHMLARKVQNLKVVGRSDDGGFWLWGNVTTEQVEEAAATALRRMKAGEHKLALHPNCGTNLVTTAFLGAGVVMLALAGSEREPQGKLQRLPLVVIGLMAVWVIGQPLGMRLQEHVTTLGDPGDLEILSIRQVGTGNVTAHRVRTRST